MSHKRYLSFLAALIVPWILLLAPSWADMAKTTPSSTLSSEELIARADDKYCHLCMNYTDKDVVAFLERLKKAIREDDRKTIAEELVAYPFIWIHWVQGKKRLRPFYTPEDFIQHYDEVITSAHKKAILELVYEEDNFGPGSKICSIFGSIGFNAGTGLETIESCERVQQFSRKLCCADNPTSSGCQQPDYNASSPPVDASPCTICDGYPDKDLVAYFERLKKAIREDDRKTIAEELVGYPFTWPYKTGTGIIYDPKTFVESYDKFMTPFHKKRILEIKYAPGDCNIIRGSKEGGWWIADDAIQFDEEGIRHFQFPTTIFGMDRYQRNTPLPGAKF